MKSKIINQLMLMLIPITLLNGCAAIGRTFQAGIGLGLVAIVTIVIILIFIVTSVTESDSEESNR